LKTSKVKCKKQVGNHSKNVTTNFHGYHQAENCRDIMADLVRPKKAVGYNTSVKMHFLDFHLDFSPEDLGAVSNERGQRFHQDISTMEKQYQGQWSPSILIDYCLKFRRDIPQAK